LLAESYSLAEAEDAISSALDRREPALLALQDHAEPFVFDPRRFDLISVADITE
jgi:hypothetical protein